MLMIPVQDILLDFDELGRIDRIQTVGNVLAAFSLCLGSDMQSGGGCELEGKGVSPSINQK
jgi:hypothetical protein